MESSKSKKLKILMLHGFTQNGRLFEIKTKALKKYLEKSFPPAPQPGHLRDFPDGVELFYPTGPHRLHAADLPGGVTPQSADGEDGPEAYAWWVRTGDEGNFVYKGIESGLGHIAEVLQRDGPFHGVMGFSQGAAATAMVASLLEDGRQAAFDKAEQKGGLHYPDSFLRTDESGTTTINPPMKFGVAYSGFAASDANSMYESFYSPPIKTPLMHVLGTVDTIVAEPRSLRLSSFCEGNPTSRIPRVVYHPGGHTLPSSLRQHVEVLSQFIRESLGEFNDSIGSTKKEERVEEMDLPF